MWDRNKFNVCLTLRTAEWQDNAPMSWCCFTHLDCAENLRMPGGKPAPLPCSCCGQEQETTKKRDGVLQETRFVTR